VADNAKALKSDYGNISSASVGAIQRRLLVLEEQGADHFFGEPAIQIDDFCRTDFSGNGVISILDATDLTSKSPRLYAAFLLWLLSDLFETLPEVGDADRPKLVLFFDEAHLLFDRAPRVLIDKIEQIVRLIPPIRDSGGRMRTLSTGVGLPSGFKIETKASPAGLKQWLKLFVVIQNSIPKPS
jgi:DNA helicase HerA-like ATPase